MLVKLFAHLKPVATPTAPLSQLYGPIDHASGRYLSFERLIQVDQFPEIQRQMNGLVEEVGYLGNNFYHRIYPVDPETDLFFQHVRQIYRSQLRSMCILNREETA